VRGEPVRYSHDVVSGFQLSTYFLQVHFYACCFYSLEELADLSREDVDYEVGVKGCPWDAVVARSYGSSDRVVGFFSV